MDDGSLCSPMLDCAPGLLLEPTPPPVRPQSARGRACGHSHRRLGPRQTSMAARPAGVAMAAVDTESCARQLQRTPSSGPARARSPAKSVPPKDNHDAMSALVLAMLQVYEHRSQCDIWARLLEPLRCLVPCEDVKVVVRCIGALRDDPFMGPQDQESGRARSIKVLQHWPQHRIEGHCALTQRICCIPSAEAERQQWHQYETCGAGRLPTGEPAGALTAQPVTTSSYLRCLVAVPLFDAAGNVLAVVKLVNRRSYPEGLPRLEFAKADLASLSAFSAIFACVIPSPYLGLPGTGLLRRPEAQLWLSDDSVGALIIWQLPRELKGKFAQEILYGTAEYEDEFASSRRAQEESWTLHPCGILAPAASDDSHELHFEFRLPGLQVGMQYAFSVRHRNLEMDVDWSEPSHKLSTILVPPHPVGSEVVKLTPGENTIEIEWVPFRTCDPGLQLIEYRVVAIAGQDQPRETFYGGEVEQVVAVFISDGAAGYESASVAFLQHTCTYSFAIEARYPYLGSREFVRALVSERFSFPTVNLALPSPQPLGVEARAATIQASGAPSPVLVRWPYPADLSAKLVLQYRTARLPLEDRTTRPGAMPRLQVSTWARLHPGDGLQAQTRHDNTRNQVRVLEEPGLEHALAVQLRVLLQQEKTSSAPSCWFHTQPPQGPQDVACRLACDDASGVRLLLEWRGISQDWLFGSTHAAGAEALGEEMGAVTYGVHTDFSRGHGPSPTCFQLRLRFLPDRGKTSEEWEELPAQLLPQATSILEAAPSTCPQPCLYAWQLQDQRWFARPGASFEVELRHGNALFWSAWTPGGTVEVQVRPPSPPPGHALRLEDIRMDSVRLLWPPFLPAENGLRDLEYRILCLELPDGGSARPEAGGRLVAWRTLDVVLAEAEEEDEAPVRDATVGAPLHYVVRSLLPDRRYLFTVEARYLGLPSGLAAAASSQLEATEPLPRRELRLTVLGEGLSAWTALLAGDLTGDAAGGRGGLNLHLRWRFRVLPASTPLPPVLCYQLCCFPASTGRGAACGSDAPPGGLMLPPALLMERGKGEANPCASFIADRSRDAAAGEAELPATAVEPLVPGRRLQFAVRVGDPTTGIWSPWSESLTDVLDLTVAPPRAAEGAALAVLEERLASGQERAALPRPVHGVEAVTVSWTPFQAGTGMPAEQHRQLAVQYEVVAWAVDPKAPALSEVRGQLTSRVPDPTGAQAVFRQALPVAPTSTEGSQMHQLRIPGDCLQPARYHYFQVAARYFLPSGDPLPEPEAPAPGLVALVSTEPYRPTRRSPPAPTLEHFSAQQGQAPGRFAVLRLPTEEGVDTATGVEPLVIEVREGCPIVEGAQAAHHEAPVRELGKWLQCPPETVQAFGDGSLVLVKDLPMHICQFRVRRGAAESPASAWTDAAVWRPMPLVGDQLAQQFRRDNGHVAVGGLQGLGVAMGVGPDGSLYARLMWPRHPPKACAVKLRHYQVRYRICGDEWHNLPVVDLPPEAVAAAECEVSELQYGHAYEFALRLCNALERWSDWSPPTSPLRLELPAPLPGRSLERGGLRVAVVSTTMVRLVWRPFTVPCGADRAEPLLLFGPAAAAGARGGVSADYEIVVRSEDGSIMAMAQKEGPAVFEGLRCEKNGSAWIEVDLQLEPRKSCSFEIRARLQKGAWGPPATSPPLPARTGIAPPRPKEPRVALQSIEPVAAVA